MREEVGRQGRVARWQGLAIGLLLLWGMGQGIAALSAPENRQRLAETLTWDGFLAGRTAAAINHVMAHSLPVDGWARAAGGVLRWGLFRSGGPQVAVGCDDWLFLTEELRPWDGAAEAMRDRAAALGRIAAGLRARGIALIVAITPDKARVHAEQLCGVRYADQAAARHAEFTELLRQAGVEPVDWLAALTAAKDAGPLYWRTDTHWNQRGAALAAAEIAAAARPLPLARGAHFRTWAEAAPSEPPNDLLRLMSLERVPDWLRPRAERHYAERTTLADPPAAGGLLDEPPAPEVALLGSSFSVNANFHGRLQQALGGPVVNFAKAGGGFAGSAADFFASPTWRETPPKLVVWEVLERALGQPIGAEERGFLARW